MNKQKQTNSQIQATEWWLLEKGVGEDEGGKRGQGDGRRLV